MLNATMLSVVHGTLHHRYSVHRNHLDLEPVAGHACLVLGDEVGALLLRVIRCREEHAFVALGLLVGAHAAGLVTSDMQPGEKALNA